MPAAVAAPRGARLKVLLSENGSCGSIRIHQERDHPGRVSGTDLAAIGAAYGYPVLRVRTQDDVPGLLDALTAPGPLFAVLSSSLSAVLPVRRSS